MDDDANSTMPADEPEEEEETTGAPAGGDAGGMGGGTMPAGDGDDTETPDTADGDGEESHDM